MNYKELLNSAAKWGLGLGILMGVSRVVETKIIVSATISNLSFLTVEWVVVSVMFVMALYQANKKRAKSRPAEVGYSFSQSVNFTVLISIFTAVIVAIASHIYIVNFIGGYDIYTERSVESIMMVLSDESVAESTTDSVVSLLEQSQKSIDAVRENPPTLFQTILSTISGYIFFGLIIGLGVAAITRRKVSIPTNVEKRDGE